MAKNKSSFAFADEIETVSILDEVSIWAAPFGQMLLDRVKYMPGIRLLDIGSGTGFPLLELAQRIDNSEAFGIDPWQTGRDRIRFKIDKMKIGNVTVIDGYAEQLPFEDNYFGLIVSNNGLNNVNDLDSALSQCHRVLKKKGQFILTVNLPDTMIEFYGVYKSVLIKNGLTELIGGVDSQIAGKRISRNEWLTKLKGHGFSSVKWNQEKISWRFSNGNSVFNHYFMRTIFIPAMREAIPEVHREPVFEQITTELNRFAARGKEIKLTIPMLCIECTKHN
jgi:arsenite methyltransferase